MEQSFPIEDWWIPRQLELVTDRSREWKEQEFHPSDAMRFRQDGYAMVRQKNEETDPEIGGEVVAGGWDHEHCALCWKKISAFPEDEHTGYTNGGKWVCRACYEMYIEPREKASDIA